MERIIDIFAQRAVSEAPIEVVASSQPVVIRLARGEDLSLLHDLAEVDSAEPLTGAVLIAFVDGRPWAAYGLDDDRVIADPFAPSSEAVGLLRLRVLQLRSAQKQPRPRWRRRRVARRVGAS